MFIFKNLVRYIKKNNRYTSFADIVTECWLNKERIFYIHTYINGNRSRNLFIFINKKFPFKVCVYPKKQDHKYIIDQIYIGSYLYHDRIIKNNIHSINLKKYKIGVNLIDEINAKLKFIQLI